MDVLDINCERPVGSFAVIPEELPVGTTSYGLVQICRLSIDGKTIDDPTQQLGWNDDHSVNRIKIETLDDQTGWFVDNLMQDIPQDNCIYYMDSFDPTSQRTNVSTLADYGGENGGILYLENGHQAISAEDFNREYSNLLVSIGKAPELGNFPCLYDVASLMEDWVLDFEVYLVYLLNNQISLSKGFTWRFNGSKENPPTRSFTGMIPDASPNFITCMESAITFQNSLNGTHWALQAQNCKSI